MNDRNRIRCLFLDIGGVLLTDGWDHQARQRAVKKFGLEWTELENRHQQNFSVYEEGKLTLDEYLDRVVFYLPRSFTRDAFREFMFAQSQPDPEMLAWMPRLKQRYGLKIFVVSNEARELNAYRIKTFHLSKFVDAFISSCFVHIRKPDLDIFRLAIDISQAAVEEILYIENTLQFVELAEQMGIRGVLHTDYHSTRTQLASYGLSGEEGDIHESG